MPSAKESHKEGRVVPIFPIAVGYPEVSLAQPLSWQSVHPEL